MKKMKFALLILFLISLSSIVSAESGLVYSLTLKYDGQTLNDTNLRLIEGKAPDRINQPENGFTLKVISFSGKTLHSFKFQIDATPIFEPPPEIFDEKGNQILIPDESMPVFKETEIVLLIPYFSDAKYIEIYDKEGTKLLIADISKYSKKPENGNIENQKQTDQNLPLYIFGSGLILILVIILIVLIIAGIAIFLFLKKQKKDSENNSKTNVTTLEKEPEKGKKK